MNAAFVYTDELSHFSYGTDHPLKPFRLKLTFELIKACGLLAPDDPRLVAPAPAGREALLDFHTPAYLDMLERSNGGTAPPGSEEFGLGYGDNPVFPGMYDWSRLVAGASLKAAELVDSGEAGIAFNISGGLHHALADRASGFCYVNDPVLAILLLLRRGRRVAYVDIDAHHGDGVQDAFYGSDRVLTVSLHETGETLFPGTGYAYETGEGAGKGFSVNVPLPPGAGDEEIVAAFRAKVPERVERFRPDVVVSQLGVDTFRGDPLAHLNLSTAGFTAMVKMIKQLSPKWIALGGGGYDVATVARAWTLAWAIMNDAPAPEAITPSFLAAYPDAGLAGSRLADD